MMSAVDGIETMHRHHFGVLVATLWLLVAHLALAMKPNTQASQSIPMTSGRWHPAGEKTDVEYVVKEGFPNGIIVLKSGDLALNDMPFRDGTIEFDVKPLAADMPGIRFRDRDSQNAEELYIRSFPDCRAENDCIQYSPVINGFMLWNVYPQYQNRAPVFVDNWNHVRLVVSGKRMKVFVNESTQPTLAVGELLGNTQQGGLDLHGPAAFANLSITPGKTDGLSPFPTRDNTMSAPGVVHAWLLGPLTPLHYGAPPRLAECPQDSRAWSHTQSERFGVVNLNRRFNASKEPPALTWVKTSVDSDHDQQKRVSMGWIGQTWVFVNGVFITSGKNFYYPESERRGPDGRLSLQNGTFLIPLHRGHNDITVALYSSVYDDARSRTPYGWGLIMRFDNMRGLTLAR